MERRRLRLHGTAPLTPDQVTGGEPLARVPTPGRCLSVADTEQGNLATLWALDMLEACAAQNRRIRVVFTAFEQPPELPSACSERIFAAASQVHLQAVSRDPSRFRELLSSLPRSLPEEPCWLMVGTPALLAFEAFARVLVTNNLGPERWPAGMRALRPLLSLEVGGLRPALARALSRALLTTT